MATSMLQGSERETMACYMLDGDGIPSTIESNVSLLSKAILSMCTVPCYCFAFAVAKSEDS